MFLRIYATLALLALPSALRARASQGPAVPTDFSTAHTAFVANGGAPTLENHEKLVVKMMYGSFLQQMTAWNQYRFVETPQDADLEFELSARVVSTVMRGDSLVSGYLQVVVREVKTHALLWTIDEPVKGAFREKTFQHNLDEAVAKSIVDLKALTAGKLPDQDSK